MTSAQFGPVVLGLVMGAIGAVLALIGLVLRSAGLGAVQKLLSLHRIPPTPVANAPGNSFVRIQGRVVPVGEPLVSPLTGRRAVTCAVLAAVGGNQGKELIEVSKGRCDFFVDDGSGQRVRVSPKGATTMVTPDWVTGNLHALGAVGINLLGSLSKAQKEWVYSRLGSERPLAYVEERIISPGQLISVIGILHRDPERGPWMYAEKEELTLLAITREEASARMGRRRTVSLVFVLVGLAVIAGGIALAFPSFRHH